MTRNIFLGADLSPALNANSFNEFIEANGAILREVDQTNFPLRAQGLAAEITQKKPDLVGLQEVAWWRTGPTPGAPHRARATRQSAFTATTTKYDFLALLLARARRTRARLQGSRVVKEEFDFEAPTDYDNDPNTGQLFGGEIKGRLTMRDVILVSKDVEGEGEARTRRAGRTRTSTRRTSPGSTSRSPAAGPRSTSPPRGQGQEEGEEEVPLRQHPFRGVRRRDPAPEHPRPAGAGAARRAGERTRSRSSSATSTPTTTRGPARRRAGVPDAARTAASASGRPPTR